MCCSALQRVAVRCNVLQCIMVYWIPGCGGYWMRSRPLSRGFAALTSSKHVKRDVHLMKTCQKRCTFHQNMSKEMCILSKHVERDVHFIKTCQKRRTFDQNMSKETYIWSKHVKRDVHFMKRNRFYSREHIFCKFFFVCKRQAMPRWGDQWSKYVDRDLLVLYMYIHIYISIYICVYIFIIIKYVYNMYTYIHIYQIYSYTYMYRSSVYSRIDQVSIYIQIQCLCLFKGPVCM